MDTTGLTGMLVIVDLWGLVTLGIAWFTLLVREPDRPLRHFVYSVIAIPATAMIALAEFASNFIPGQDPSSQDFNLGLSAVIGVVCTVAIVRMSCTAVRAALTLLGRPLTAVAVAPSVAPPSPTAARRSAVPPAGVAQ